MIATCLVKLSISLFLLRFTIERKYTWTLYVVLATLFSYSVFLLFFALFQCKPVSAFWNSAGNCNAIGTIKVTYAHSVIISISDWTLIILPIFMVYHLNLGFLTKLYVGIILALGSWYVTKSCPVLYREKKRCAGSLSGKIAPALPLWQDLLISMISLTLEISFSTRGLLLHHILRLEWPLLLRQWLLFDHFLFV